MKFKKLLPLIIPLFVLGCSEDQASSPLKPTTSLPSAPPNIVFIITDDMYPHMFNVLPEGQDETGSGRNVTPNIDRIAQEGSFLSNTFVASPVCTPSRYNVLTGNYASRAQNKQFTDFTARNENQTVIQWNSFITPGVENTVGNHLQKMGYRTGFVGKNHVIESLEQIHQDKSPDLYADPTSPAIKAELEYRHEALQDDIRRAGFEFADNLYHDNPRWLGIDALASQNMDWITEGGVRFLRSRDERPFFLYFATTIPHGPTNAENSWLADPRITPKGILDEAPDLMPGRDTLTPRAKAAGRAGENHENLIWLDDAIGVLLETLEATGEIDNTILFFFNDHGQNQKGTLYQGGIRSQAFVWQKDGFSCGSVCDFSVSNTDFLETILEMAGARDIEEVSDGSSFYGALNGTPREEAQSMYFELGYMRAVIKGDYKYIALRYPNYAHELSLKERQAMLDEYNSFRRSFGAKAVNDDASLPFGLLEMVPGGGGAENAVYRSKPGIFEPDQLYNLKEDPMEETNLANKPEHQKTLTEMRAELQNYLDQLPGTFNL
ncbi:sulfatase family protein [Gilvimarinus chinensis]|uniref:sulfatase family protein n=1 Tax=Gilvimarinus chinensis TaxID=396005 RepID=UPI0012F7CDAB|nr:sulfatase-like hydrolase/transferase [Gilvimarinus chinensis]